MCEPYKEYEKDPSKVLIDNRLQMIYFNGWSAFIPRFELVYFNRFFATCHNLISILNNRYIDVEQDKLNEFNKNLDWLNNGSYSYHLPRHGSLFTKEDFDKADKNSLPIKIASYIFNLPFEF